MYLMEFHLYILLEDVPFRSNKVYMALYLMVRQVAGAGTFNKFVRLIRTANTAAGHMSKGM